MKILCWNIAPPYAGNRHCKRGLVGIFRKPLGPQIEWLRYMLMAEAAVPVHENAVAVSGGWGMVGATPEERPVVAGSGAPDLFGEAENELMCPAS